MQKPISVAEAFERIRACGCKPTAIEYVGLDHARGRRLAENLHAPEPWPTTDRSAMDGFACGTAGVGTAAGATFAVVGQALAGHPFDGRVEAGQAVRIMTGGVVPAGADTVVMVEKTSGFEGESVRVDDVVPAGANIRRRGSEIGAGDLLLARGTRIRAAEVGGLAVLGRAEVAVFGRPRVAILSTGDEVVPLGRQPAPHQVADSNSWALAAQVEASGGEPLRLGICDDDADALRARLDDGLARAQIVLTIGGVSKGTHDLVHGSLSTLGVEEQFHGVAIKPGKPLYFGRRGADGPFVFGLPGNPASAFTTFWLFVRPLLLRLAGAMQEVAAQQVRVGGEPFRKNWRAQAMPARLRLPAAGESPLAELFAARPSGDPFSVCDGDGLVLVPAGAEPGSVEVAAFYPFDGECS